MGDRVLMGKYAGTDITLGGEEYVIMREDDILAVIDDERALKKAG